MNFLGLEVPKWGHKCLLARCLTSTENIYLSHSASRWNTLCLVANFTMPHIYPTLIYLKGPWNFREITIPIKHSVWIQYSNRFECCTLFVILQLHKNRFHVILCYIQCHGGFEFMFGTERWGITILHVIMRAMYDLRSDRNYCCIRNVFKSFHFGYSRWN